MDTDVNARRRIMKKKLTSMVLFGLLAMPSVFGQTYNCTIQNESVYGGSFYFDIYMSAATGTIYFGPCTLVLLRFRTLWTDLVRKIRESFRFFEQTKKELSWNAKLVAFNRRKKDFFTLRTSKILNQIIRRNF